MSALIDFMMKYTHEDPVRTGHEDAVRTGLRQPMFVVYVYKTTLALRIP